VKFKLDENLPVSSAMILTSAGHDVDTVTEEGLVGAPDRDLVAAATVAGRILVSMDRGLTISIAGVTGSVRSSGAW
jgi:predicted nuclease of predicted toxin-antitoxin system